MEINAGTNSESNNREEDFKNRLEYFLNPFSAFDPNFKDEGEKKQSIEDIQELFKEYEENVREVDLSNHQICNFNRVEVLVEGILQNKNIRKVNFSGNMIAGQRIFRSIAKLIHGLPQLNYLDLSNTIIADKEMEMLVDTIIGEPKGVTEEVRVSLSAMSLDKTKQETVISQKDNEVKRKTLCINDCEFLAVLPYHRTSFTSLGNSRSLIGNDWVVLHENIGEVFRLPLNGEFDGEDDEFSDEESYC